MPTQYCECGAKYRFPDSAVGKRAKCKKCGVVLVLRAELDDGTLGIAPVESSPAPSVPSPVESSSATPIQGKITKAHVSIHTPLPGDEVVAASESVAGGRGYGTDVLWTFLFPAKPSSLITFLVIWGFMTVLPLFMCVSMIGIFFGWVLDGWFAAYQFEVLGSAAAGEDDIPQVSGGSVMLTDLFVALLKWCGSWILVMLPACAYMVYLVSQGAITGGGVAVIFSNGIPGMLQGSGKMIVFQALVFAGVFLWPIVALCIALDSLDVLYRVDLVVVTIIRTLPAYLLTLVFLFGAVALEVAIDLAVQSTVTIGTGIGGILSAGAVLNIVGIGVHVYTSIVVMRLIGLYYFYGKKRFAWSWE